MAMRRVAPWLLLSLVLVGAAIGMAIGLANTPSSHTTPSRWVAEVLTATKMARTAHLSYSQVTTSPNIELRSSVAGNGVVDFATGDVHVTEVDRGISFRSTGNQRVHPTPSVSREDAIVIGRTVYEAFPFRPLPSTPAYIKLPFVNLASSKRGLSMALGASGTIDAFSGPYAVASVINLGQTTLSGVTTTRYEVTYAPLHICNPHQARQVLTQRPSFLWLDRAGRLVQARSTTYFYSRVPHGGTTPAALNDFPEGPVTTVATLRFSEFGGSVHIDAPPTQEIRHDVTSSEGLALIKSTSCRS